LVGRTTQAAVVNIAYTEYDSRKQNLLTNNSQE
jgi:hypothetical protein